MKVLFKSNYLKYAFTLAEILIVIGVVGTIAAMTIPSLLQNINNRDLGVQLKKSRSTIANALNYARVANGGSLDGVDLGAELGNYVKLAENCNLTHSTRCWHKTGVAKIVQKDGTKKDFAGATTGSAVTMDGMYIRIAKGAPNCSSKENSSSACYDISYNSGWCSSFYVDINGKKNPNIYGQDIRELNYWSDGYVTFPGDKSTHSRWSATRLKDASEYTEGNSCYDGNNYSAASYEY